jgi:hypothetical protein
MANSYGEGFQKPVDFFTGEAIPGAPAMHSTQNGKGHVVLRDDEPKPASNPPATDSPSRPTGFYNPRG